VAVAKHLGIRNGNEWVEFEERPRPRPPDYPPEDAEYFNVVFVEPNPPKD